MRATMRRGVLRLWRAIRPGHAEDELRREIDAHLVLIEDEYRARGLSPDDARAAARRQFGAVERVRGLHRDARSFPWLDDARQDVWATARALQRRPWTAAAVVGLVALAVGGVTTLSSVVYGVLFRPLPWPNADALVRLEESRGGRQGRIPWTISNASYLAWREQHETIAEIGGWRVLGAGPTLTGVGDTRRIPAAAVTPSLFGLLGAMPALGRPFVDDDAAMPVASTVILSHGLWQTAFGGRADVVGQVVRLDGRPHTVAGVMPATFAFPDATPQLWLPMHVMPVLGEGGVRRVMIFGALARLQPGVTASQAGAEATARARHAPDLAQAALALFGNNGEIAITAAPARDVMTRDVRTGMLLVWAAVALLFLTAVASVLGVQLARTSQRRREIAIRAALGAGASRMARQWVAESLVVGSVSTGIGLAVAAGFHRLLPRVLPSDFPRASEVTLDPSVMAAASLVALLASTACGLVPAWLGRRAWLSEALAQDSLAPVGGSLRMPVARGRALITTAQVATACLLLVVTGVMARSLVNLVTADRGYDPRQLLTARVALPASTTLAELAPVMDDVRQRLRADPGVQYVGFGNALPFVTSGGFRGLTIPSPLDPSRTLDVQTAIRVATPDYFRALRLRIRAGRMLSDDDRATTVPAVVVNRSFETQYLGGRAVGRRLALNVSARPEWEVVGVIDDMRQGGLSEASRTGVGGVADPPLPELFFTHTQWRDPVPEIIVVLRTTNDPAAHVATLRGAFRAANPALALDNILTMDERLATSLALPRLYVVVLGALGSLALMVAAVGVFGVLAHAVAHRTREIGVRTALGATRASVVRLVARQALLSVVAGLVVGTAGAVFGLRLVSEHIYGVSPRDPVSVAAAIAVLTVVAALAVAVPIRRALRVDPLTALRSL